jgi:hypothetical protein
MKNIVALAALVAIAGSASARPIIDGSFDAEYGAAISVQQNFTQFGDSNIGLQNFANGSELDAVFCSVSGGNLNLFFTGNLESNFNKFDVFFDTGVAGQNKLRGDNAGIDFNGLNRMGDDGSGNGLTFDTAFQASRYLSVTGGDVGAGTYKLFANAAILLPGGGGQGEFLGENLNGQNGGTLSGGNNFAGALVAINNSNLLGVSGSSGAGALTAVNGIEISIPLSWLGVASADGVKVSAFINGSGHDFVSNQVLGSLPSGTNNLGEPRAVNFSQIAGDQYFVLPTPGVVTLAGLASLAGLRRRRA